jgi:hypothetical protein
MANKGDQGARDKKRQERRAKRDERDANRNKRNPLVEEARARYAEELRNQGVETEQLRTKVRAHVKGVIKPAMSEAKAGAKSNKLTGPARKKFIQDTVRAKLGTQT